MDKVYIVEDSSGSWDSYTAFMIGVYTSPEAADIAKQEYMAKLDEYRNRFTEADSAMYDIETDEDEHLWSAKAREWWNWKHGPNTNYGDTPNGVVIITEVSINQMLYKFE